MSCRLPHILESGIAGDFIDTLITRTQNIRVGDPFDPETEIGALGSMTHMEKVLSYVGIGQKEGGNLLTGARGLRSWLRALYAAYVDAG